MCSSQLPSINNCWQTTPTVHKTKTLQFICLFCDFLNKLEESASVRVWTYSGNLSRCAVFHCLGGLSRTLLDAIPRQNVNDADEVNLVPHTICDRTKHILQIPFPLLVHIVKQAIVSWPLYRSICQSITLDKNCKIVLTQHFTDKMPLLAVITVFRLEKNC